MSGFTRAVWEVVTPVQCHQSMRLLTPTPGLGMDLGERWGLHLPCFSLWGFGEKAFLSVLCEHLQEWRQTRPVWEAGMAAKPGCDSESVHPPPWQCTGTCVGSHTHIGVTVWLTGLQSLVLALTDLTSCQQCPFIPQKLRSYSFALLLFHCSPRECCSAWNASALCQAQIPDICGEERNRKAFREGAGKIFVSLDVL